MAISWLSHDYPVAIVALSVPPVAFSQHYLARAAAYMVAILNEPSMVETIRGIWVASDDPHVVTVMRLLAPKHFPNVEQSKIVWISAGGSGAGALLTGGRVKTASRLQVRTYVTIVKSIIRV